MTKYDEAVKKILDLAIADIGYFEDPPNSNQCKYNDWIYDKKGHTGAWCGAAVSYWYHFGGSPLGKIDMLRGFIGCQYAVENVHKWGKQVTVPAPGDIIFYDWEGDGTFDHTAIFEKDLGGGLLSAIEGNTAIPKGGTPAEIKKANSHGGIVMRRSDRKYKNAIFVRPNVLLKLQEASL